MLFGMTAYNSLLYTTGAGAVDISFDNASSIVLFLYKIYSSVILSQKSYSLVVILELNGVSEV